MLFRRLSIGSETPDAGAAAAEPVALLMGRELGWDEARRREEIDRYFHLAQAIPRGTAHGGQFSSDPEPS